MISLYTLLINTAWIVGAAWVLAAVGYRSYTLGGTLPALLGAAQGNEAARPGALLFCAGMAGVAPSWLFSVLWLLLCAGLLYGGWREWWLLRPRRRSLPAEEQQPSSSPMLAGRRRRRRRPNTRRGMVAERIIRLELLWLALLAPFFILPDKARVWVLLGLPALWIARRIARGRFLPGTPLDWPLALLMLMALVSLFVTGDLTVSLGKLGPLLWGVGVYYAIVEYATTERGLRWAIGGYAVAGAGLAIAGLLGTGWAVKIPALSQVTAHLPSLLRNLPGESNGFNPNIVGGALLWVVPLQMSLSALSWREKGNRKSRSAFWGRAASRLGLPLLLTVSGGALLLMQSRNALVCFALAVGLLLWLGLKWARPILLALLVAGIGLFAYIGPQRIVSALLSSPQTSQSLQSRIDIWSGALHSIQDFAFTGTGMGMFSQLLPVTYPIYGLAPADKINHAQNQLLQAALDLGVLGLIAFLAVWIVAAALVFAAWRNSTVRWYRWAAAGIGAGLFAHFLFGFTDAVVLVSRPGVFFWALLGLLVALWKHTGSRAREQVAGKSGGC